jgi:hypothetical protein
MNIKQLALAIIITLNAFQSIYCINLQDIDFAIAQPLEIAQAIASHSAKVIAAKTFETGIANIPLANLELLLAHEQIGAKIVSRMNYINDITKENVYLFIEPIADNFDHINQHTLEWILYLEDNNPEYIIPIFAKNFRAILEYSNGCKLILNILKDHSNCRKLLMQPIIDNFSYLAFYHDGVIILKIMEFYPDSMTLFIQPVTNNFLSLANDYYSRRIILEILESHPDLSQPFIKNTIDNFIPLATNNNSSFLIVKMIDLYPEAAQLFVQCATDNFVSLINDPIGSIIVNRIIDSYPESAQLFAQPIIDNSLLLLDNDNGRKLILKTLKLFPHIEMKYFIEIKTEEELIMLSHILKLTSATEPDSQHQAYKTIINLVESHSPSIFMQCILNNFRVLVKNKYGQAILLKIIKNHPKAGHQLAQNIADNLLSLADNIDDFLFVRDIMELVPDSAQLFVKASIDNFPCLLNKNHGHSIILEIIDLFPDAAIQFTQPICDNLRTLLISNNYFYWKIVATIMFIKPDTTKLFEKLARNDKKSLSIFTELVSWVEKAKKERTHED